MPRKVIVCFGSSGRRILNQLRRYRSDETMQLTMVKNIKSTLSLLESHGRIELVLVSRLDDRLLTEALSQLEYDRQGRRVRVTGLFIYPTIGIDDLSAIIVANRNLRKVGNMLDFVRVVNLPDYAEGSIRPSWPLQFYDDKMTDAEKQVVCELLKSYHTETR